MGVDEADIDSLILKQFAGAALVGIFTGGFGAESVLEGESGAFVSMEETPTPASEIPPGIEGSVATAGTPVADGVTIGTTDAPSATKFIDITDHFSLNSESGTGNMDPGLGDPPKQGTNRRSEESGT